MKAPARLTALLLSAALLLTGCGGSGTEPVPEPAAAELELYFFNAGKADAILLSTRSSAVLIDAGETGFGAEILAQLEAQGIETLDLLIVTHFDKDHVGGAAELLAGIPVKRVLQSNQPKDSKQYAAYAAALAQRGIEAETVRELLDFSLDGVRYTVDPPRQSEYEENSSNNSSLIVTVEAGSRRFLLAGDAQTQRLAEFLDTQPGHVDLLKLPHHVQEEPLLEQLLAAVTPDCTVITSSGQEPESEAVTAALEQAGSRVLLTRLGAVRVRCGEAGLSVTQEGQSGVS